MMKKKLAALLCGVMCITSFTGCSREELAWLEMNSDMMDSMSSCLVEGSIQADVDFDAFEIMAKDVSEALYGEGDEAVESGLSGKKSLTVDYDMQMNLDMLEYDMVFDVTYDGKTYDLGKLYYSLENGVFVTGETLWGAYQIYRDMTGSKSDEYILSDAFAEDFRNVLAEKRYIELTSAEDLTGIDMSSLVPQQGMTGLYDAVFTFYKDVLNGFETGMVKEINGGYQIKADGRQAAQLLADLLHFAAENPQQIIDATETYMMAVMDSVEVGTAEETAAARAEMAESFAAARESQDEFIAVAEEMALMLEMAMEEESVAMVLDSFRYAATVKKVADQYHSTAAYTVKHEGMSVGSVVTDAVMKKADVQIFAPATAMSLAELEKKLADLENKYNPVKGVSVTWGSYGENEYADIITMRSLDEVVYFHSGYNWSEIIIENGRAYLPLRVIAESLGEEVGWENSTKTPYVMQNGERIDMKGKLQDDRAFVGVRDFEKLGYTVTYTFHKDEFNSLFDYKEALIEK